MRLGAGDGWRAAADRWLTVVGVDTQTDRCAKLCYDSVYYLATLINTWKAGGIIDGLNLAAGK